MTLQDILFGSFTPPPQVGGFVHRIGFASEHRYTPPPHRKPRKTGGFTSTQERALAILKQNGKPMASCDLAPLIGMDRNRCSILLAKLFKKGVLTRHETKKPGTRYFNYRFKEDV